MKERLAQLFEKYPFIHFDDFGQLSIIIPLTGAQTISKKFSGNEDSPISLYLFGDNTCKSDLERQYFFHGKGALVNAGGQEIKPEIRPFDNLFIQLRMELAVLGSDNALTQKEKKFIGAITQFLNQLKLEADSFKRNNPGYEVMKDSLADSKKHFIAKAEFCVESAPDSVRNLDLPNILNLIKLEGALSEKIIPISSNQNCLDKLSTIVPHVQNQNKLGGLISETIDETENQCRDFLRVRKEKANLAPLEDTSRLLENIYSHMRIKNNALPVVEKNRFDTMADNFKYFLEEWNLADLKAAVEQIFTIAHIAIEQDNINHASFSTVYSNAIEKYKEQNPDFNDYPAKLQSYQLLVFQTFLFMFAIHLCIRNPDSAKEFLNYIQKKENVDSLVNTLSSDERAFMSLMYNEFDIITAEYDSIVNTTNEIAFAHVDAPHYDELRVACSPLSLNSTSYMIMGGKLYWSTVPITQKNDINSPQQQKEVSAKNFDTFYNNKEQFTENRSLVSLIADVVRMYHGGSEDIIFDLISKNMALPQRDKEQLLSLLIEKKAINSARFLIENGASSRKAFRLALDQFPINIELIDCIMRKNPSYSSREVLELVLDQSPINNELIDCIMRNIPSCSSYFNGNMLITAAKEGRIEKLKIILKYRPDLMEYKDNYEQTAFLWACAKAHVEIVRYLMGLGANIYARTILPEDYPYHHENRRTALQWAQNFADPVRSSQIVQLFRQEELRRQDTLQLQEQQRLEQQRLEQQRLEQQRLEQQRLEQQRLEQQRLEQQRLEQQRLAQQRLEQEHLEEQRLAQQRLEQQRLARYQRLVHLRISRINNTLDTLQNEIGQIEQHNFPEAAIAAAELLNSLNNFRDKYRDDLLTTPLAERIARKQFNTRCEAAVYKAKLVLERDLGWGDYLGNLLKMLVNTTIWLATTGSVNSFFSYKNPKSVEIVDQAAQNLKQNSGILS